MTKPRHLRKHAARTNSKFVPFVLHTGTHTEEGACNRTSSWLVTAPPSTVGFQTKSRRQAYRNGVQVDRSVLVVRDEFQTKSRRQAYRNAIAGLGG